MKTEILKDIWESKEHQRQNLISGFWTSDEKRKSIASNNSISQENESCSLSYMMILLWTEVLVLGKISKNTWAFLIVKMFLKCKINNIHKQY